MAIVLDGSTGIANDGGYTGDGIVFADTTPANTLVTTTGGNVGIGTSSPGARLNTFFGTAGAPATSGSVDANLAVRLGVVSVGLDFGTYGSGSSWIQNRSASNYAVNYDLVLQPNGGSLLVGTTINQYAGDKLSVSNPAGTTATAIGASAYSRVMGMIVRAGSGTYIEFFCAGTSVTTGAITTGGTTTSYNTSSDYRLKEDIQPMTGALARVAVLKPVTYKWKADGSDGEGFIAHELQEVCPDAVTGEKDAVDDDGKPQYQGVDTSFLVATLTAAIQEQQAIITALTARVETLEAK
jgi:hypothetical protein